LKKLSMQQIIFQTKVYYEEMGLLASIGDFLEMGALLLLNVSVKPVVR